MERLKDRVEELVANKFAKRLIEAMITDHCRKGSSYKQCNCSYCSDKKWGTLYMSYTKFPWQRWDETLQRFHPLVKTWTQAERYEKVDYDYIADAIMKEERARKRYIVRAELKKRKEEIL